MKANMSNRFSFTKLGVRSKFALLFYLVTLLSLTIVGYYGYSNAASAHRDKAKELVRGHTSQSSQKISDFLNLTRNDLNFFATNNDLMRHIYWQDIGEEYKAERWKSIALDSWQNFVRSYDYLYKVRFLNLQGQELITIRRDPQTRIVQAMPDQKLQNKKNEHYFLDARALEKGGIKVSPLGLNREFGKIERPLVPVVRISQSVFGDNNVKYGVLVISLFAEAFFEYIKESEGSIENGSFYLIDQQGEFLYHPEPGKSFGLLLGHSHNFRTLFPDVFQGMQQVEDGTFMGQGHVFGFKRIYPLPEDRENYWIMVGMVDEAQVFTELTNFKYVFFSILAVVIIMVFVTSRLFLNSILSPLIFVTRQLQRLGMGEVVQENIEYHSSDEIGQILDSTRKLTDNMELVATQADVIAQGDFTGNIKVLSNNDRLGNAINNMTEMLRENKQHTDSQTWLKDGISKLNQKLNGNLEPRELANRAISTMGHYLDAGRGVFYVFKEGQQQQLTLLGSYMYTEREALSTEFNLGEGAIGQVAVEKSPIALTHLRPEEAPITSGTASGQPLYTYTFPLLQEDVLVGVIELAAFKSFTELQKSFIEGASHTIAGFISSVLLQRKISNLLKTAETAATEAREQRDKLTVVNQQMEQQQLRLQQQTEELQQANTQMEEQQQQLQQQTEELQQSNSLMEEQQQQLQQQTEELQQSNSQMEEQQQQLQQQAAEMETKNADLMLSKEELNRRAQELEQSSRYKSEFLANMSHELRTPLNSVILLSKMLSMNEDENLSDEEQKRASVIHQAGEELLRLINDILDLSKIEAGKMELNIKEVFIDALLDDYLNMFGEIANVAGIEFKVKSKLQDTSLFTDREKLSQIIRNLLSNAFKFTKQGHVSLIIEASGREDLPVKIMVEDTGIGIPEQSKKQIFEAFQQVDGSVSRQFGGTGLGLSISMNFAQLLGGTIELESELEQGSRFSILLPHKITAKEQRNSLPDIIPQHMPKPGLVPASQVESTKQVHDDRQNLKSTDLVILVIDDDTTFTETLALLNKKEGYKTLIASSGIEGLRMAKTYRPEGILLDLGLPDMDGSEVLHELKSTRELCRTPVYIISGREKQHSLLKQGIVGYLQKPANFEQLVNAEAQIIDKARAKDNVLLILGASLTVEHLKEIIIGQSLEILTATDLESSINMLSENPALVVVDIDRDQQECVHICRELKLHNPLLPIIVYGNREPNAEEEHELRDFIDSIIIRKPKTDARMLENIERFLQDVPESNNVADGKISGIGKGGLTRLENRHILIVDDDPRNLFVITSALEQAGAHVETALNGIKALEYLNNKPDIDIIFMDIMMPGMDGYEAIGKIKNNPSLKHIPVIALTAKALRSDKDKVLSVGADDYLSKPVDYEVLINMASVWCETKL